MHLLQLFPALAYCSVAAVIVLIASGRSAPSQMLWIVPAALGLCFAAFSIVSLLQDGILQFWVNHTANLAGNQVWFDLVMALAIGFFLLAPRSKAVGMPLMPWGIAVIATACVALLPMLARTLWLEQRRDAA